MGPLRICPFFLSNFLCFLVGELVSLVMKLIVSVTTTFKKTSLTRISLYFFGVTLAVFLPGTAGRLHPKVATVLDVLRHLGTWRDGGGKLGQLLVGFQHGDKVTSWGLMGGREPPTPRELDRETKAD